MSQVATRVIGKRYPQNQWIKIYADGSATNAIKNGGAGSRIVLEHTPARVAESLTKTLTLRCALEDTVNPNASDTVVGLGGGQREVGTETISNADVITSIVILRDGEIIASLEENSFPTASKDKENIRVIGDLALPLVSGSQRAFLELMWTPPGYNQSGEYTCAINATSSSAQNGTEMTYAVLVEIGVQFPSKQDLLDQMSFLQMEDQTNREKLAKLLSTASLLKPAHTESGVVDCGDSGSWRQNSNSRHYVYKDVKFRKAYTGKAPIVSLGIRGIDVYRRSNLRMHTDIVNLNTQGFRVRCGTWGDTHIYGLSLRWTSVDA
ncbi:agglutinin [Plakobranchus ocellatus]|uniref:Agglutinin n=1 Tax=Plakobranchus ocellatus TaxID=259542 RepID=A0AAV3YBB6_9GAST|nr:agglutinin [Plakobranchus ocellatus]